MEHVLESEKSPLGQWQASAALSEPLRRLLSDLAKEVSGLAAENAALRQQLGSGAAGAQAVVPLAGAASPVPFGPGEQLRSRNCGSLSNVQPSPQPDLPANPPELEPGTRQVYFRNCLDSKQPGLSKMGSFVSSEMPTDTQPSEEEGHALTPPPEASPQQMRQWQQQFVRLSGGEESLSAHNLWVVVSRHEHQLYGHNKHPQRAVARTVRLIRQAYGNDDGAMVHSNSYGGMVHTNSHGGVPQAQRRTVRRITMDMQEGVPVDLRTGSGENQLKSASGASTPTLPSQQQAALHNQQLRTLSGQSTPTLPRTMTPNNGLGHLSHHHVSLDWDIFLEFMRDEESERMAEEEGDGEYLRKALHAESNEFIAEESRREIARRQTEEQDPRPAGWRAMVLEQLPPPVILVNAVCLGLQSDIQPTNHFWDILELFFLAFYLLEISLTASFLGPRRFFRGSEVFWNLFDLACIMFSLTDLVFKALQFFSASTQDPSLLAMLKFFRLARLARIIKSLRSHYFDDLRTMSLGILSGAKVLAWAVILFFACVFVLGVIMKELAGQGPEALEFRTVPASMSSVFRCLTGDCSAYDGTPLHEKMRMLYGARFLIPYILVFLVVNFGLFNLIVAVFIDRVVSISIKAKQQDLGRREREMRAAIEEMIVGLMPAFNDHRKTLWSDQSALRRRIRGGFRSSRGRSSLVDEERLQATAEAFQRLRSEKVVITRELFSTWLTDPEVLQLLESLEVDTATKSEIFDVCDVDKSGGLTCDELVNGLMRLRGPISKCDVIAIRLKVRYLTKVLEDVHHTMGA